MATTVLVASGFTVSSAVQLTRGAFALHLPSSCTATIIHVQHAATLDANSAGFATRFGDNTGAPLVVASTGGPFISAPIAAVTPFVRVRLLTAAAIPTSFAIHQLAQ